MSKRLNYYEIKHYIEVESNSGCELLSTKYINNSEKLLFRCFCGQEFAKTFQNFKGLNQRQCKECGIKIRANKRRLSYEEVKKRLLKINSNIEILSKKYINSKSDLYCRCKICNHEWFVPWSELKAGNGCPKCRLVNMSGENSNLWNPNLSIEEREKGRDFQKYNEWRRQVFKRDKYTCQCCGDNKGHNLNAHHLNGWNWDKQNRLNIDNGIILCDYCHKNFHYIYGYGDNTKEQYEEFMKNKNHNKVS